MGGIQTQPRLMRPKYPHPTIWFLLGIAQRILCGIVPLSVVVVGVPWCRRLLARNSMLLWCRTSLGVIS